MGAHHTSTSTSITSGNLKACACAVLCWGCTARSQGVRCITHRGRPRKQMGGEGSMEQRDIGGTSTAHRRNIDGTTTEQKSNANGQMGLCVDGEGQAGQEPAGAPGGGGGRARAPGHSRTQAGPRAKHTFCINCKTRDLNDRPFRCQSKTLATRPQTVT